MKEPIIKHHADLAKLIKGKRILHLNSLGKDATLCLTWLTEYAEPSQIVSVFFRFMASHPDDDRYFEYLKKRYVGVNFLVEPDAIELSQVAANVYQTPIESVKEINHWEYIMFSREKQIEEIMKKYELDYICNGASKYESFARRSKFHQKGLEFNGVIYPLGMMSKKEVIDLIKYYDVKLHPCYKFSKSGYDTPSYWKMKRGMIANPEYEKKLMKTYPMFICDKFRYEKMLKPKSGCIDWKYLRIMLIASAFLVLIIELFGKK